MAQARSRRREVVFDRGRVQDIQRARIVGALVQAVCDVGVQQLSVAQIVSRAGVSRRTFYELFSDCGECFLAAFDHCVERIAAHVLPAYEGEGRWHERMRAGLAALLQLLDDDPCVGRLVFVEVLGAGPAALELRRRVLAPLIGAVDEGRDQRKGAVPPGPLVAEGVVGAVGGVIHTRMLAREREPFLTLLNPLMSMIVLPYLGANAARAELNRPLPVARAAPVLAEPTGDVLKELGMRLTYRTACVLMAIAESPGASNRRIGAGAGIADQGQVSKLLRRLQFRGLVENDGAGFERGMANAWRLTARGEAVQRLIGAGRARA